MRLLSGYRNVQKNITFENIGELVTVICHMPTVVIENTTGLSSCGTNCPFCINEASLLKAYPIHLTTDPVSFFLI